MANPNPVAGFDKNPQNINRNGRPKKGYSITEWFKKMLKSDPKIKDALGKAILSKALRGDTAAQRMIWNYMDGLPKQIIEDLNDDNKRYAFSSPKTEEEAKLQAEVLNRHYEYIKQKQITRVARGRED